MKVEPNEDGIIIIPETYFEQCYLQSFLNVNREVILKHSPNGLNVEDLYCLKIKKGNKEK